MTEARPITSAGDRGEETGDDELRAAGGLGDEHTAASGTGPAQEGGDADDDEQRDVAAAHHADREPAEQRACDD